MLNVFTYKITTISNFSDGTSFLSAEGDQGVISYGHRFFRGGISRINLSALIDPRGGCCSGIGGLVTPSDDHKLCHNGYPGFANCWRVAFHQ